MQQLPGEPVGWHGGLEEPEKAAAAPGRAVPSWAATLLSRPEKTRMAAASLAAAAAGAEGAAAPADFPAADLPGLAGTRASCTHATPL